MVLPPLMRTVRLGWRRGVSLKIIRRKILKTVRGSWTNWVRSQSHMESQSIGSAKRSWRHVCGKRAMRMALAIRNRKQGYQPIMSARVANESSSSGALKTGDWLRERASDWMTNGSWMEAPYDEVRRMRRRWRVDSGDVEMGEKELGEQGDWRPEPLALLPAWMLSLLGHIRDNVSDVHVGIVLPDLHV